MDLRRTLVACLALLAAAPHAHAEEPGQPSAGVGVAIEAPVIDGVGSTVRAAGGVTVQSGRSRIAAEAGQYDFSTSSGSFSRVAFTTCDRARPDYRIEARELVLLPSNRIRARRVSLFVGGTRVLTLPSMRARIGARGTTSRVFPRPGFDNHDGFTISQMLRLTDTNRSRTNADLQITTRHGIQGQIDTTYGLDGNLADLPGRSLSWDALRASAVSLPREPYVVPVEPADASRLRATGVLSLRERTYDVKNNQLIVYRRPEVGLTYLGRQLSLTKMRLDPRLEIHPEVDVAWGRFREVPGIAGYASRASVTAAAAVNVLPLGPSTSVQPVVSQTYATYSTGETYHLWTWAVDASSFFRNGSFASVRYIKRNQAGSTPFEFDDLDIERELQGAVQVRVGRHTVGLVGSYDADAHRLYEWDVLLGYRTDCLSGWVRWNNRTSRLTFDVAVISM